MLAVFHAGVNSSTGMHSQDLLMSMMSIHAHAHNTYHKGVHHQCHTAPLTKRIRPGFSAILERHTDRVDGALLWGTDFGRGLQPCPQHQWSQGDCHKLVGSGSPQLGNWHQGEVAGVPHPWSLPRLCTVSVCRSEPPNDSSSLWCVECGR